MMKAGIRFIFCCTCFGAIAFSAAAQNEPTITVSKSDRINLTVALD